MRTITVVLAVLALACSDGGPNTAAAAAGAGGTSGASGGDGASPGGSGGAGGGSAMDASLDDAAQGPDASDAADGFDASDHAAGDAGDSGASCADFEEPYGDGCDRELFALDYEATDAITRPVADYFMQAWLRTVDDAFEVATSEPLATLDGGPVVMEYDRSTFDVNDGIVEPYSKLRVFEEAAAPFPLYVRTVVAGVEHTSAPRDVYLAGKTITRVRCISDVRTVGGSAVSSVRWELRGF